MENLKIRVNGADESKEIQNILESKGFKKREGWSELGSIGGFIWTDSDMTYCDNKIEYFDESPRKEITLQELRAMVHQEQDEPFLTPECTLNDQYAEIEEVRQSHRTASEIADSALKHIRERAETYDQPTGERSAAKTAMAFNAITGKDITESEVWLLLQLLKDVRQWSREDYHQDSAEDCIAYAALKAESLEGGK